MRRFVIIEKYCPWLWKDDEVIYHDRDFMVVNALDMFDDRQRTLHGFVLFDKNYFENYTEKQISDIARLNHSNHYNGLPLCKNRRIFAPYVPAGTNDCEKIIVFLQEIRSNIIRSVEKQVANKYELMMERTKNYIKDIREAGKDL